LFHKFNFSNEKFFEILLRGSNKWLKEKKPRRRKKRKRNKEFLLAIPQLLKLRDCFFGKEFAIINLP